MFPGLSLVQFLVQLPMFAVLIVGFGVLSARRRRLPRRTVMLGHAGCGVLLVATVFSGGWAAVLPRLLIDVDLSSSVWGVLTFVVGMVQVVLYAGGIGLLLAALVARTGPVDPGPATDTWSSAADARSSPADTRPSAADTRSSPADTRPSAADTRSSAADTRSSPADTRSSPADGSGEGHAAPSGPAPGAGPGGSPGALPPGAAGSWNAPPAAVWNGPPPGGGWNGPPPGGGWNAAPPLSSGGTPPGGERPGRDRPGGAAPDADGTADDQPPPWNGDPHAGPDRPQ